MTRVRVWAPKARQVDLCLRHAGSWSMEPTDAGWWSCEVPELPPGTDYGFSLDGGETLPDPRSPWQPEGVTGMSRVVDHSTYEWSHASFRPAPLGSAVIYETHIGTFTPQGTFTAAIDKLEALAKLGVTHVELMPVAEFSGSRGWGYDGVLLYAPHHAYGSPEDLKRLVDACHARGLAVILDVVYNHLGPEGNHLGAYGDYFTTMHTTPWGAAVNLDGPGSDEVRRYFIDNALMWLRDYYFDGLRLDAVHSLPDFSATNFLEQMESEVEVLSAQVGRELALIAESNANDPRIVQSQERGGFGLQAVWCDDFHHALHALLTGESQGYYADFGGASDLAKALRDGFVYDGRYSVFRRRRHGRAPIGVSPHKIVVATQTHDQVGNRARGERLCQLVSLEKAKIAAALLLMAPQVPMLFQGEEWAASSPFLYFTEHSDPELAKAVAEGRRREFADFGWRPDEVPDPQDLATFEASCLNWDEREQGSHAEMLDWYRQLLALRRAEPELRDGRPESLRLDFDEEGRWLRMRRGALQVLINLSSRRYVFRLGGFSYQMNLASNEATVLEADRLLVPAEGVAILRDANT